MKTHNLILYSVLLGGIVIGCLLTTGIFLFSKNKTSLNITFSGSEWCLNGYLYKHTDDGRLEPVMGFPEKLQVKTPTPPMLPEMPVNCNNKRS